jgi:transposase-like protein
MWVKIASPNGEMTVEPQGRRRAVKRQQNRVLRSALGGWPEGHWASVPWQIAEGEKAPAWKTFFGQLAAKGMTEATTTLVGSDGAQGLENALADSF